MQSLSLFSPAKINLFLHITGKRADGYHDLQSVFRAIDFGDELTFSHNDTATPFVLTGADHITANPDDNLIIKAAKTLANRYPQHAKPVAINIKKRIPTGAGLGGGSSNCATTLLGLNTLWQLNLSTDELIDIAKGLGADVPFFIFANQQHPDALAEGIGEKLSAILLPNARYLLLFPDTHMATAAFFAHPQLQKNCPPIKELDNRLDDFCQRLHGDFGNVFEPLALDYSQNIANALSFLRTLESQTHSTARMSGTGSTVFLPLPDDIDDQTLTMWQKQAPCNSVISSSIYK